MAKLAAISPTRHHPSFSQTSHLPASAAPPITAEWEYKVEAYQQTLTQARLDVFVMIGSDGFHQLWLNNMPHFLVGRAPFAPPRHQHPTLPRGTR